MTKEEKCWHLKPRPHDGQLCDRMRRVLHTGLMAKNNVIPMPRAKKASQVRQNAGALGWILSTEDVSQLEKISRNWL